MEILHKISVFIHKIEWMGGMRLVHGCRLPGDVDNHVDCLELGTMFGA